MAETVLPVLLYGLMAAASPLALAVTLVVLKTRRARLNGAIFAVAFLLGEAAVLFTALGLGSVAIGSGSDERDALAGAELALGVALLWAAARRRERLAGPDTSRESSRTRAVLDRLAEIRPLTALGAGLVLGIGGPKRLTLTVLAATTIAVAGVSTGEALTLVLIYGVLAAVLVWAPVAVYLLAGTRSEEWLAAADDWLVGHERTLTKVSMVVLGILLVADAVGRLV